MDNTVPATGQTEQFERSARHPREDWARFMRVVCAGCRFGTVRTDSAER